MDNCGPNPLWNHNDIVLSYSVKILLQEFRCCFSGFFFFVVVVVVGFFLVFFLSFFLYITLIYTIIKFHSFINECNFAVIANFRFLLRYVSRSSQFNFN